MSLNQNGDISLKDWASPTRRFVKFIIFVDFKFCKSEQDISCLW